MQVYVLSSGWASELQGFVIHKHGLNACRLAQANKDMAELNSRLVDAAFGNAFAASLSGNFTPSASGLDREDTTNQFDRDSSNHLDRDSSNPAASSSGEQNSIMGLPPGVPLDPFYDE
jgi:hypothetical protein